jgi:predicted ester cyclase
VSTEDTAAFWERWEKADGAGWNEGNVDGLDEVAAPNFVRHSPPFPDIVGLAAYKKYLLDVHASYPDVQLTTDESIYQGDVWAGRGTFRGTLTGRSPMTGAPGTGQKVDIQWCAYIRAEGGKVIEMWALVDFLNMVQQLGFALKPKEAEK